MTLVEVGAAPKPIAELKQNFGQLWQCYARIIQRVDGQWVWHQNLVLREELTHEDAVLNVIDAAKAVLRTAFVESRVMLLEVLAKTADGFDVSVMIDDAGVRGRFGEMTHDFADVEEALQWAKRALLGSHALHIGSADGKAVEWRLMPVGTEALQHDSLASGLGTSSFRPRPLAWATRRNGVRTA